MAHCFLYFSFNPENYELKCYNVIAAEARSLKSEEKVLSDIFKSELAVPTCTGADATRSHCALHVLGMYVWKKVYLPFYFIKDRQYFQIFFSALTLCMLMDSSFWFDSIKLG